jgi:hypothetical protein
MHKLLHSDLVNAVAYGCLTLGILGSIAGVFWFLGYMTGGN